jgi:hypothetical protein
MTPTAALCHTRHNPLQKAQSGYDGYCKACYRSLFPRAYADKLSARQKQCCYCGESKELLGNSCRPCLRLRTCATCADVCVARRPSLCRYCVGENGRTRRKHLVLWCTTCTSADERKLNSCRACLLANIPFQCGYCSTADQGPMHYLECNVADCDSGTLYCTACAPAFAASAARTCKSCWRRHISDDMWRLYLTRVFSANDARLRQAMFNTEFVRYLVHRHSIRTRQSYQNAVAASRAQGKALFIKQASDIAHEEDKAAFTDGMRRDLMLQSNPRHTTLLPSFLPLYVGMRLSLYSKDCVRLGHMNGCECILEKIVFSDLEDLPRRFTRKRALVNLQSI